MCTYLTAADTARDILQQYFGAGACVGRFNSPNAGRLPPGQQESCQCAPTKEHVGRVGVMQEENRRGQSEFVVGEERGRFTAAMNTASLHTRVCRDLYATSFIFFIHPGRLSKIPWTET